MFTDPILDAWMTAVDTATARRPELAPWFEDRDTLVAVTDLLIGYAYAPGDAITEKGTFERSALVLARGRASVLRTRVDGEEETIREVVAPTTLGAVGFAIGRPRSATVRAAVPSIGLELTRGRLFQIAERSPFVAIGLLRWMALDLVDWLQQTRGRRDAWSLERGMAGVDRTFAHLHPARRPVPPGAHHQDAAERVKALACFGGGSAAGLTAGLGEHVHAVEVDAGGGIVSDGDVDRSLLVLLEGRASVRNADGQAIAEFTAASSHSADVLIGELSFLTDTGRDGTVIADTDCTLLEIRPGAAPWITRTEPALSVRLHCAVLATVCSRIGEQDVDRDRTAAILDGDFDAWLAD